MVNEAGKYRVWLVVGQILLGMFLVGSIVLLLASKTVAAQNPIGIPTSIATVIPIPTSSPTPGPICPIGICGELGDAPELGMTAYPTAGVTATFPTIYYPGSLSGPIHHSPEEGPVLGSQASLEVNANQLPDEDGVTNIDPANDLADRDEADDGLEFIASLAGCQANDFAVSITKPAGYTRTVYANVWLDFERDGDWDDVGLCDSVQVPEWGIQNQPLSLTSGTQSITLTIVTYHPAGKAKAPIWLRISLTEARVPNPTGLADGRGPAAGYLYGETEDYLLIYNKETCVGCGSLAGWQG